LPNESQPPFSFDRRSRLFHYPMTQPDETLPIRDRYRIRFAKIGLLRWIGHRDLQRLWERLLRRAGLRLSMSEGFHPKPRISFPSALALGIEGLNEVVEVELAQVMDAPALRQRLIADNQPGLEIRSVQLVARANPERPGIIPLPGFVKAKLHSSVYEIRLPQGDAPAAQSLAVENTPLIDTIDQAIQSAKIQGTLTIRRKDKTVTADVASTLPVFYRRDQTIHLVQLDSPNATLKPTEILDTIGLDDLIDQGASVCRTQVNLVDEYRELALATDRTPLARLDL